MKSSKTIQFVIVLAVLSIVQVLHSATPAEICFREDFNALDKWQPLIFPKISNHSRYSIEHGATGSVLQVVADKSASGLLYTGTFDARQCRTISWRWKVSNVYGNGNALTKSGDDYPLRIYVLFTFDPERATFFERLQYGILKSVHGKYPPHSSLNYIWASRQPVGDIVANAYTDRAMMIVLQSGGDRTQTWVEEQVDVLHDYRRAFGAEPPATATIAVMGDADDTGESAAAWLDYIEVRKEN